MLLVDTVSTAEVLCAAAAALVGGLAAGLVLASETPHMRPNVRLLVGVVRQLVRVPADLWLLARELARALAGRRSRGRFHEVSLEIALDPGDKARRAEIELFGSLAPNTIVLGVDEHHVVVHQLVARHSERESVAEIGS
jgi:hypothetical protein